MEKEKQECCCCCEHEHEEKSHGCGCGCKHEHEEGSLKQKIILIVSTAVLLAGAVFVEKTYSLATWQLLIVYLIPYLLIGHDTLMEAWEGITEGDIFNEDF